MQLQDILLKDIEDSVKNLNIGSDYFKIKPIK